MTPEDAPQISDPIMSALLAMLTTHSNKPGGVHEDALLATSTLVEGKHFTVSCLVDMTSAGYINACGR